MSTQDPSRAAVDGWPDGLRPASKAVRSAWTSLASDRRIVHQAIDIASAARDQADALFVAPSGLRIKDLQSGDLLTDVDLRIERQIVQSIIRQWPDHGFRGEEDSDSTSRREWTWIIDPLDGTNNYAVGLPNYAVSLTLARRGSPVLAVLAQGMSGMIAVAEIGRGSAIIGKSPGPFLPASSRRVALWLGYSEIRRPERAIQARTFLSRNYDRVFETWCPINDMFMALRGGLQAIIGIHCAGAELPAALLLLRELGWSIELVGRHGGSWLDNADPATVSFIAYDGRDRAAESALLAESRKWSL